MCGGLSVVAVEEVKVDWAKRKVLGATRDETRFDKLDEESKLGEVETEVGLEEVDVR
jgi:hypothetical protein